MKSILKMLPSVGPFAGMAQAAENVDEGQFTRVESIINSMTNKERHNADLINGSRRKRIAAGSGTTVQEVNNLLRQYTQMSKMFKTMGGAVGEAQDEQRKWAHRFLSAGAAATFVSASQDKASHRSIKSLHHCSFY